MHKHVPKSLRMINIYRQICLWLENEQQDNHINFVKGFLPNPPWIRLLDHGTFYTNYFKVNYFLVHFLLFVCLLVICFILLNVINMSWWEGSPEPQVILVSASDQVSLLYSTANISSCYHNSPRHLFLLSRSKWTDQAREKPENEITQRRAIINSDFYKLRWNSPPQAHRARWVTPFYNTMLLQLGNKILH